jgi:hypothetical protein
MTFPNQTWNRFKPIDTVFTVSDSKKIYDIRIALSVMDGFKHSSIPVEIVITAPSGQKNIVNKFIVVKDEYGRHTGSAYGDVWTVELPVYNRKEFMEEGTYSINIHHRSQYYELFRVVSLSFIIFPAETRKQ